MVPDLVGNPGETVTRKIDQTLVGAQFKEIDELGTAGRLAGACKLPTIHDHIDRTGFAGIRAPGDGYFRASVR